MTMQPQMTTRARVDQTRNAEGTAIAILRFSGDIGSTSRETVFAAYQQVPADTLRLVLDFSRVDYMNSSGLALIIELLMDASKASRTVHSFGLSPHFQKVFTMVGLNKYTHMHPDEAAACAAFARP